MNNTSVGFFIVIPNIEESGRCESNLKTCKASIARNLTEVGFDTRPLRSFNSDSSARVFKGVFNLAMERGGVLAATDTLRTFFHGELFKAFINAILPQAGLHSHA